MKPQNVLISNENQIKIIDFNVSRSFDASNPRLMTKTGDPKYNAPEMFSQGFYDPKIDVWSTGLIMFHLATGVELF